MAKHTAMANESRFIGVALIHRHLVVTRPQVAGRKPRISAHGIQTLVGSRKRVCVPFSNGIEQSVIAAYSHRTVGFLCEYNVTGEWTLRRFYNTLFQQRIQMLVDDLSLRYWHSSQRLPNRSVISCINAVLYQVSPTHVELIG
jgi:hypothetical protein